MSVHSEVLNNLERIYFFFISVRKGLRLEIHACHNPHLDVKFVLKSHFRLEIREKGHTSLLNHTMPKCHKTKHRPRRDKDSISTKKQKSDQIITLFACFSFIF